MAGELYKQGSQVDQLLSFMDRPGFVWWQFGEARDSFLIQRQHTTVPHASLSQPTPERETNLELYDDTLSRGEVGYPYQHNKAAPIQNERSTPPF